MMRAVASILLVVFLVEAALIPTASGQTAPGGGDLFTTRVRPILSQHCFKCHGPDDGTRKARLRLDVRDEALRPASSGAPAIVPGRPDESELISRIFAEDEGELMPPPRAKIPLSGEEKEILRRWVAEGAEYKEHWAFVAPRQVPPPEVRRRDWPQNAIDRFILARLEAEGLSPSPRADGPTLVRRLYLDLLGLPPTPAEMDEYLRDPSPDAYERLVDRLLASPHYGERWARRWLDLARYADSNGYEKDRARSIWPYRDWVIRALNADLPFDRFTVEQIAGDMLPGASPEQRVATGFHRNTMLNEEGGIDPLEYRFYAMTDRVATTATTWLGLTLGCAQCHTHKYDPIPHRDYYRFMALLNNADEPEMPVPSPEIARRRSALEDEIAARVAALPGRFPLPEKCEPEDDRPEDVRRKEHLERAFRAWLAREQAAAVRWTALRPEAASANLPRLAVEEDGSVVASGDMTKSDAYTLDFRTDLQGITAIRLEVLPDDRLPKQGPGRVYYEGPAGDFFLSEFAVIADGEAVPLAGASHSFARKKFGADQAIDGDPQTGWSIDGGQGRAHAAVFRLGSPPGETGVFRIRLLFERYYAAGLGRFRISATTDPRPVEAREMPAEIEALLSIPECERTESQRDRLLQHFLTIAPELASEREQIEALRKQMPPYPTTLVMQERPSDDPRPTFLHNRGEYLQPTERVEPAVLSILPPLPPDAPRDRLALARWLVSPQNPLVGRVTMNRQWAAFFGRGIVRTTQDFGYQGDPPSHPELLDWLAVEFVKQGWSMKRMHKLIVMSETYRQASRATPALLAKDPENRLLARGPRVRLEAEAIRDQALRVSGLLSEKVGGPSVFPPQPPGVTTEGAYGKLEWKVSPGGERHRRGLYTFAKRTAPYAMAAAFDAPSGEVCVARREVSNTPLQALTLLNDPAFHEAAQALGAETAAEEGTVSGRVAGLFRRCLARPPDRDELALMVRFYEAQRCRFERGELDASAVAGPGEGDAVERAAWTALARALLNLDEAITKG
jgi:hypothetical protein